MRTIALVVAFAVFLSFLAWIAALAKRTGVVRDMGPRISHLHQLPSNELTGRWGEAGTNACACVSS